MSSATLESLSVQIGGIAEDMQEVKDLLHEFNGRQRIDHDRIIKLEQRQKALREETRRAMNLRTGANALLSLIGSALATIFGGQINP